MTSTFESLCRREFRRGGFSRAAARALAEIGNVVASGLARRVGRDPLSPGGKGPGRRRLQPLAEIGTDLRSAFRSLTQRPAFTAVGVLTLASGIAAGTAVFSVVDSILLRPLPYERPETLVRLMRVMDSGGFVTGWRAEQLAGWAETDVFNGISAYRLDNETLVGGREPERIQVATVTPGTLGFLGVRPAEGRGFVPGDGEPGAEPVVILEHGLARRRFGSSTKAIGEILELLRGRYRVIGVMPDGFRYPYQYTRAWIPRSLEELASAGSLNVHARIPEGLEQTVVQERADALADARDAETLPALKIWPAGHVNTGIREGVLLLFGAAALLVLIACANTANLLLARSARRGREVSVRSALGAARSRLIRQALLESLLLAGAAGLVGFALAGALLPPLLGLAPDAISNFTANPVDLDGRALAFALGVSLFTSVLFGLVPALRGSRVDISRALGGSRGTGAESGNGRLRSAIIVAEVALTLLLLFGASLLVTSFWRLASVDLGVDLDPVVALQLAVPEELYPSPESQTTLAEELQAPMGALEGVEATAYARSIPPGFASISFGLRLETEKGPVPGIPQDLILPWTSISPGYFEVLDIPVLRGRGLEPGDPDDVVVLSRPMAEALWPEESAIGRRFRLEPEAPWLTVVGVVADVKMAGPDEPFGTMEMYRPFPDSTGGFVTLIARSTGNPGALVPLLRDLAHAVDPRVPVESIAVGGEGAAEFLREARFQLTLVGTFAAIASLLAAFGIFGVISYAVGQRRGEMGVRMAMGASPTTVVGLVVGSGLRLAGLGIVLGVALGWLLGRLMESFLFEIEPTDPRIFLAVSLATLAIAFVASLVPGLRAGRVDPVETLRVE